MLELRHEVFHGNDLVYRSNGAKDRPTLLLIHGMAGSSRTWLEAMNRLGDRYNLLAPDLPGHGESGKPKGDYSLGAHASALRDLLERLNISEATLVGHSLGGGIALQFVYQFPELSRGLVLVSSGGLGRDVSPLLRAMALPGSEWVLPLLVPSFVRERGRKVRGWLADRGLRSPRFGEMWDAYASLGDAESRQAFVRELRSVVDFEGQFVSASNRFYLTNARPVLIVWGDSDPIIPVAHAHAAHEAMPGSRLEIFEKTGHFPHAEYPERFAQVLTDFVDTPRSSLTAVPAPVDVQEKPRPIE